MLGIKSVKLMVVFLNLILSGVFFTGTVLAKPDEGKGTSQKWAVVS